MIEPSRVGFGSEHSSAFHWSFRVGLLSGPKFQDETF